MTHIRKVSPEEATGSLKQVYDAAMKRAGYIAEILRVMSQTPATLQASMSLYIATMLRPGKLSRAQREMIAVVVSRANNCYY